MTMQVIRRIKTLLGLTPTPIRTGHVYVDQVTGETFEVASVGRNVSVVRQDAENRPEHTVRKSKLRTAISEGVVVHDEKRCSLCRDE